MCLLVYFIRPFIYSNDTYYSLSLLFSCGTYILCNSTNFNLFPSHFEPLWHRLWQRLDALVCFLFHLMPSTPGPLGWSFCLAFSYVHCWNVLLDWIEAGRGSRSLTWRNSWSSSCSWQHTSSYIPCACISSCCMFFALFFFLLILVFCLQLPCLISEEVWITDSYEILKVINSCTSVLHILFAILPWTLSAAIKVWPFSRYFIVILCVPTTGSFTIRTSTEKSVQHLFCVYQSTCILLDFLYVLVLHYFPPLF